MGLIVRAVPYQYPGKCEKFYLIRSRDFSHAHNDVIFIFFTLLTIFLQMWVDYQILVYDHVPYVTFGLTDIWF
jgi:hypothetical protein